MAEHDASIGEFSRGYYRVEMQLQPYEDGPIIERGLHDYINYNLYQQTDAPVTLRVGMGSGPYFSVEGEAAVPTNVLALPREWLRDMGTHGTTEDVFILKPEHSFIFNQSMATGKSLDTE